MHVPVAHTRLHSYLRKIKVTNVLKELDLLRQGVTVCRIRASQVLLLLFCLLVLLPSFAPGVFLEHLLYATPDLDTGAYRAGAVSALLQLTFIPICVFPFKVTALIWQFYY